MEEKKIEKELIQIKSEFKKDKDFKKYYAVGAVGGFKNKYDFRLSFYDIESNDLIIKSDPIKIDPDLSDEEKLKKFNKLTMEKTLLFELIMTEQSVRELHKFLGKELDMLEMMKEEGKVDFNL